MSSDSVPYLGSVTVTATLDSPASTLDRTLTITERTVIGTTFTATGAMDGSQSFSHTFAMHRAATFTGTWGGDDVTSATDRTSTEVEVGSRTLVKAVNSYGSSGAFHLYHYSQACVDGQFTKCPRLRATVMPVTPSASVCFTTQQYVSGTWTGGGTQCIVEGPSSIPFLYHSRDVIGRHFRFMAAFQGSVANLGSTSVWRYFRVTT